MLDGFLTVGAVVVLGVLLARWGVLDAAAADSLARLSLVVASPALMVVMVGSSEVGTLLSGALIATAGGVLASAGFYVGVARIFGRRSRAALVIGALCAVHVNSGSLGIPIAVYVLDDAGVVLPMMMVQLIVLQPVGLVLVERISAQGDGATLTALRRSLTHPLILATMVGFALALTGARLPSGLEEATVLVGAMAVPSMLLSYGAALRSGPPLGRGTAAGDLVLITVTKLAVHPTATYVLGRYVVGVDGGVLVGITVIAALPSAQNVFILATHYRQGVEMARDAILATTLLAVPALLLLGAVIGTGA